MDSKFLKNGYELSLVLDISSESIGGSIVVQNAARASSIIYSTRIPIIWEKPATHEPLLIKIKQALTSVMKQLHTEGLAAVRREGIYTSVIAKAFVTYASPWYLSQTKGLTVNYDKPMLITKALLRSLIEQEEQQFLQELQSNTHSEVYRNAKIIERRIVDTKLNGYPTDMPYDKKAQKIELSIHTSFVSHDILLITHDSIYSYFHCETIKYGSFPLVAYGALSALHHGHDSIIVDVRGETTDLSFIKNAALWESLSFPIGSGALLRAISAKTNTSIHIAESLLHIYYQRNSLPEVVVELDSVMNAQGAEWSQQYRAAVKDLTGSLALVKTVHLIVDPRLEKYFTSLIRTVIPDVKVEVVHGYHFYEHVHGVSTYADTPLALEIYFARLSKINSK